MDSRQVLAGLHVEWYDVITPFRPCQFILSIFREGVVFGLDHLKFSSPHSIIQFELCRYASKDEYVLTWEQDSICYDSV